MDAKDLTLLLEKDNIISIMEDLGSLCSGIGTTSDGMEYYKFRTICHDGDSSDKLWWYTNNRIFQCWTCCGTMSVYDLVMKVRHCTFKEAFNYVASKLGISLSNDSRQGFYNRDLSKEIREELAELKRIKEACETTYVTQEITNFYDEKVLNMFDDNTFYQGWIDEGITEETMRKFKISFYWLEGHIIIPHYNADGKLVGIRRRSLNPEDSHNKYMPEYYNGIAYGHSLALNLYGLYQNKEAIKDQKTAILVEGEKSVMLSDSYYGDKSITVATCGFNVSKWQIEALNKLGVTTVYLGLDKDYDILKEPIYQEDQVTWKNYERYKERIRTLGERLSVYFKTYIIQDRHSLLQLKDSPFDRGKETLERLIKQAKILKIQ